jgi:DNA ligase 4
MTSLSLTGSRIPLRLVIRHHLGRSIIYDNSPSHPLTELVRRYFFHASNSRIETDEYMGDEDDDVPEANSSARPAEMGSSIIKEEVDVDMDPALADWFKVDDKASPRGEDTKDDVDSATDEDSDNADVAEDEEGERKEDDLDEWLRVKKQTTETQVSGSMVIFIFICVFPFIAGQSQESFVNVKMGESEAAMEYDQEFIFKHLFVRFKHSLYVLSLTPLST